MKALHASLTLALLALSQAAPLEITNPEIDPELAAGYVEGDMIYDNQRSGHRNVSYRWPANVVYYRFHVDHFGESH